MRAIFSSFIVVVFYLMAWMGPPCHKICAASEAFAKLFPAASIYQRLFPQDQD